MAIATFDTLKFVETLESAGVERKQASAIAFAVRDAHDAADLVTKKDLEIALAPIRSEQKMQRALLTAVLGGVIALIVRSFF